MHLTRTETINGMLAEYRAFADLLDGLDDAGWKTPSRCTDFDVRDVAGHVVGLAEDVAKGVPGSRTAEEEAASVREDGPAGAATRLRAVVEQLELMTEAFDSDEVWDGPSGVPDLTMGHGVLTLWYDTWVHADDIRDAIGDDPDEGPGRRGALAYLETTLTDRVWGPARIELTDADETLVIDDAHAVAVAPLHRVAARDFILAATGRLDATTIGLDDAVNIYAA